MDRRSAKKTTGKPTKKSAAKSKPKGTTLRGTRPKAGAATKKRTTTKGTSTVKKEPKTNKNAKTAQSSAAEAAEQTQPKRLSNEQLEFFKTKLLSEKQRVLEEMGEMASSTLNKSISDQSGENSRYSYHLGDVASLSYGREFSMGLAERQQNYLEQIDDALQRIEEGTYGICKVTGEPIPTERLEEVPVAKYSVRGKEILEYQKRHGSESRRPPQAAAPPGGQGKQR